MKDQLRLLDELQALEKQKQAVAGRKARIDAEGVRLLWQEIRGLTQELTADREKLAGIEATCARHEADLEDHTRQCRTLEQRLYGGEITNVKEIEQVRARCESLRRDISRHENEAVAGLEAAEELTAGIAAKEAGLQEKKRLHAERQQLMAREAARCDAELADLDKRCRALEGQVDPALLRVYRDTARRLPQPVARVENGICGGCRRSIPTGQAAQAQVRLLNCDNCGRMLFVE